MSATIKVILLTGTPIINYSNEIGVLYNILRGYIKTWNIPVTINTKKKINKDEITDILNKENFDFMIILIILKQNNDYVILLVY